MGSLDLAANVARRLTRAVMTLGSAMTHHACLAVGHAIGDLVLLLPNAGKAQGGFRIIRCANKR